MIKKIIYILLLLTAISYAQTITFDEFLTISKGSLNREALLKIRDIFPKNFVITALDYADFSGDNKNDIAIAIRPLNRHDKKIYVYLFCDSLRNYVMIHADTLEFFELPIEIGFSIAKNVCYITQKLRDRNWAITGYSFKKNELTLVDYYTTDVQNLGRKQEIGTENYDNYSNLQSFVGFYDVVTLNEFKKSTFFYHPVYDKKRNVYPGYGRNITVSDVWKWSDETPNSETHYGSVQFSRDGTDLLLELTLSRSFSSLLDTSSVNEIQLCFDRSTTRLLKAPGQSRKGFRFRESIDEDVARFVMRFRMNQLSGTSIIPNIGKNFINPEAEDLKFSYDYSDDLILRFRVPLQMFNLSKESSEMGVFISAECKLKDGSTVLFRDTNGDYMDPSSYARLVFLEAGQHYGSVDNSKFSEIADKLRANGIGK
ncbi:MAG: hypothetical protein ACM3S2_15595 [Ignavibacteriales bacterium]